VVLLTGNGPSPRDGGWAFCSGGDQRIRGRSGYQYADGETADTVDAARVQAQGGRLHILEVQRLIRTMPKVVIAVVGGWAAGGGHSLHVVCDLTIASRRASPGSSRPTRTSAPSTPATARPTSPAMVGQKFGPGRSSSSAAGLTPRPRWTGLRRGEHQSRDHAQLEDTALQVAGEILGKSPQAQRMLKFAFNLVDDGLVGQQVFAGEATRLAYMTDEALEGRDSVPGEAGTGLVAVPLVLLSTGPGRAPCV
jgi:naphthoate synthase